MRRLSQDGGAVSVFVAIIVAVLLGFAGLVVDVGALYFERRQLQTGADAAALAIAEACARDEVGCSESTALVLARQYAAANSNDGYADVTGVTIDHSAKTVTVQTSTLNQDGSTILASSFAGVLGFEGSTVYATAIAEWGNPSALFNLLPLVISICEFRLVDSIPSEYLVLYFADGNNQNPCRAEAGLDADGEEFVPAGFAWLQTLSQTCDAYMLANTWHGLEPGNTPKWCSPSYLASLVGTPIPLPVFNGIRGSGKTAEFHIMGWAYFEITGYNFGGQYKLNSPCSGDERCMSGRFTTGVIFDGDLGGPDLGIAIVKLTG